MRKGSREYLEAGIKHYKKKSPSKALALKLNNPYSVVDMLRKKKLISKEQQERANLFPYALRHRDYERMKNKRNRERFKKKGIKLRDIASDPKRNRKI